MLVEAWWNAGNFAPVRLERTEERLAVAGRLPRHLNGLYVRKTRQPDNKPLVDHLAFSIEKFNKDAVEAELNRRGLNPKPDSEYAWTIQDPDGYTVQICAEKGLYPGAGAPPPKK